MPAADRPRPRIAITYCTQCQWLLRAAWMAQELLSTFTEDLAEVALVPAAGGTFFITFDGEPIWDPHRDGGFPAVKTLNALVRDGRERPRALATSEESRVGKDGVST